MQGAMNLLCMNLENYIYILQVRHCDVEHIRRERSDIFGLSASVGKDWIATIG